MRENSTSGELKMIWERKEDRTGKVERQLILIPAQARSLAHSLSLSLATITKQARLTNARIKSNR